MDKIKILTMGDHPLAPTGVGIQSKLIIEALLKTGKFTVISLAGAQKHKDPSPSKTEEFGDDWKIFPVDGYGTQEIVRSVVRTERPDILWFMTDPRYWEFLWQIEDEIRPLMPMVYYHVWDNYPYPNFNKKFYESNDVIATISKVTDDIVKTVSPGIESHYIPHSVDSDVFKQLKPEDVLRFRSQHLGDSYDGKKIFFWNNRNSRRKQGAALVWWFKEFLDNVGHDKACLIMHTNPKDRVGPDLEEVVKTAGLNEGQVLLSPAKYDSERMAMLYNMADCTINISDAEGFGLSTLESLACGTPIITTMTGGLQEQVTDGKNWFGVGITPSSSSVIGTQQIPYIYEDRISKEGFLAAMDKIYNLTEPEKEKMITGGLNHVKNNYSFEGFVASWVSLMEQTHQKHGSWDTRKGYQTWELLEVA